MKKITSALLISLALSGHAHAEDKHYLTLQDTADSVLLLSPPPAFDSVAFLADKAAYEQGKYLRSTPRGAVAFSDADSSADNVTKNFSTPFGFEINAQNTPATYELISTMKEDAGDYATKAAKEKYNRIRPFAFFHEPTCRPDDESKLAKNGSYPSGHTAIGWSIALVLAEINPQRQNEILKRGFDLGQSRVICGYHWQSDVDAARVVSSAVVARLHGNPQFASQLAKAKDEIAKLNQNGK